MLSYAPNNPTSNVHRTHFIFACAAGEHFAIPSEKTPQSDTLSYFTVPGQGHNKKQMAENCSKLIKKMEVVQNYSK